MTSAADTVRHVRLLFLIADTGGGHRASANAVARELRQRPGADFEIRIVDPFVECSPAAIGATTGLYGPIIKYAPWFWGALYHSTNSRAAVRVMRGSVLRPVQAGIARLCRDFQPDAVVSFHPLLNHAAARALRRRDVRRVPLITVITDLVDVHASWVCRDVDAVVTPSPGGLDRARRAGVAADRCFQIGLPVDGSFTAPPLSTDERRALRRRLGVDEDGFVVLLCSGADGSGGLGRRARALARSRLPVSLAVICGRNERLRRRLSGIRDTRGRRLRVLGFVDNMAEWTRAADLVVTKAGPGTIAETLCCGTPLLLTFYIPGQERGNVEWLADVGAGRYVPTSAQMLDAIAELATPGSPALARMRAAVAGVARPDATREIGDLVSRLATPKPSP